VNAQKTQQSDKVNTRTTNITSTCCSHNWIWWATVPNWSELRKMNQTK